MPVGPGDDKPSLLFTLKNIDEHVLRSSNATRSNGELGDLAYIDSLTGLRNRRYFDVEFARSLMASPENGGDPMMAVLFIDVDYFKQFNDRFGHQRGDECLRTVAKHIQTGIRKVDLPARYGGKEFVVVLKECSLALATRTAERIRGGIEALSISHDSSPFGKVTVSIGIVHTTELKRLTQPSCFAQPTQHCMKPSALAGTGCSIGKAISPRDALERCNRRSLVCHCSYSLMTTVFAIRSCSACLRGLNGTHRKPAPHVAKVRT